MLVFDFRPSKLDFAEWFCTECKTLPYFVFLFWKNNITHDQDVDESPMHKLYVYGVIFRTDFISGIRFWIFWRNHAESFCIYTYNSAKNQKFIKNHHRHDFIPKFCVDFEKNVSFRCSALKIWFCRIILHETRNASLLRVPFWKKNITHAQVCSWLTYT